MKLNSFTFLQGFLDFASLVASFACGYAFYVTEDGARSVAYSFQSFLGMGAVAGVLFCVVFRSMDLYERKVSLLNVVETKRLLVGWALASLILIASTFYFRVFDLSRLMISWSLVIALILLLTQRGLVYRWYLLASMKGVGRKSVAIYGAGIVGRHLYKRIYHSPGLGLHVIGFFDDNDSIWGREVHMGEVRKRNGNFVLGGIEKLRLALESNQIKEVFVALPNATYQRNLEIVQLCRQLGVNVSVVPPTYGHQMHNLVVEDIGGIPVLREKQTVPHLLYPITKRCFDIVVSALAITFLSPIFLLLSLLVKFDSPGPVIFRQKRVGLNGIEFDFLKFRTMYVTSNPYALTPTSAEDPRITRFGRRLRRTSLDELPQFWNVLIGQMSIVGPRPEMPFIVNSYTAEQRERLKVKPGITGVWQISAVRGEPIHANMEYDLFYIEHRSLLLDLIIMIKTVGTAIRGIGAV